MIAYGNPGDVPVVGDWTGGGHDGVGVVRNGSGTCATVSPAGSRDRVIAYGNPGDTPVVGDWSHPSSEVGRPGVVRNGVWYLRNSLTSGIADTVFAYGDPGDRPVTGAWAGVSPAPASVTGKVTTSGADPLADVSVRLWDTSAASIMSTTTTASDGTYLLSGVAAGSYLVQFYPASETIYAEQWWNDRPDQVAADEVTLSAGQALTDVNGRLTAEATISGVVTDTGGHPLGGVDVKLWDHTGGVIIAGATTAEDGSYSISDLPASAYKVQFLPPMESGFAEQWWNDKPDSSTGDLVAVTAGETRTGVNASLVAI